MLTKNDLINTGIIDPNSINEEANRITCKINTSTYCGGCHIYCFDDISYDGDQTHTATIMSKDLIEESINNGNKTFVLFNQNNDYHESIRNKYPWLENYYIFLEFDGYDIKSGSFIFDCLDDFNHNELSNIISLPESYHLKNRKRQKTPHKQENYKFVLVKKDTSIFKSFLLSNRIKDEFTMNKKVLYETGIIAPTSVKEEEEYNRIVFKFDTYDNPEDNPECHIYEFMEIGKQKDNRHVSNFKDHKDVLDKIKEETIKDINNGNRIYIIVPPNTNYYINTQEEYPWLVDYFIFIEIFNYKGLTGSSFSLATSALNNIKKTN